MADGGDHSTFRELVSRIRAHYGASFPPDDETTRYLLLPEFPFKTAKVLFDVAAGEMVAAPPERKGPLDDEDVLTEILCRLPPLPSSLARACLVSRLWARLGATAAFRRRLLAHHRKPPVLGLYERQGRNLVFIPTLDAPDAIPPERFSLRVVADHATDCWHVLGCRQGRVLVINRTRAELLVFDPISGDRRLVAFPPDFVGQACSTNGAVVVDELHGQSPSPFQMVLVGVSRGVSANGIVVGAVSALVFSSETGAWGDLVSTLEPGRVGCLPCTKVGNGLYWWLAKPLGSILHFDLGSQRLAMIDRPPVADINIGCSRIIRGEDGGVGLAVLSYPDFCLYDRKVDSDGVTAWPLRKIVAMDNMLDLPAVMEVGRTYIVGYDEESDAVFMSAYYELHTVQLDSMQHQQLDGQFMDNAYYPFASFYTGGPSALQLPARVDNVRTMYCTQELDWRSA